MAKILIASLTEGFDDEISVLSLELARWYLHKSERCGRTRSLGISKAPDLCRRKCHRGGFLENGVGLHFSYHQSVERRKVKSIKLR